MIDTIADAEPLPEAAERLAQQVAQETGETCCIAAAAGQSALLVYAVESRKPIRFSPWLGERNPIHCSASGRAILAQYSKAERERIYRRIRFKKFTDTSPMSIAEVEATVAAGEARGYFLSEGEFVDDLVSIAAPLPLTGRVLAVVVAAPMSRYRDRVDEIGPRLRDLAANCVEQFNAR